MEIQSRRLYDIANVLKSLGLIRKQKNNSNKNVYRWMGSNGFTLDLNQEEEKHNVTKDLDKE